MKKISKMSISPEKIMKNEELINLKGGYGGGDKQISCKKGTEILCRTSAHTCEGGEDACIAEAANGNCGDWKADEGYSYGCA